jgi:gluconate:H+ symporter, GntP family
LTAGDAARLAPGKAWRPIERYFPGAHVDGERHAARHTGSATIATITAAGIMAPLVADDPSIDKPLLVLAVGCGSLFLSHVNDAGFWLVNQYFGMSVKDTLKTWSVMETLISTVGFAFVLLASLGV